MNRIQKWGLMLGVIAVAFPLLNGCIYQNSKNLKELSNSYKSIALNRVSVGTNLSYLNSDGFTPKYPNNSGDPILKEAEKKFLVESGERMIKEVIEKAPCTIRMVTQNATVLLEPSDEADALDSEKAKKICENLNVDAVMDIRFEYFYANRSSRLDDMLGLFGNIIKLASGKARTFANCIGIVMRLSVYDKAGRAVLSMSHFAVSKKINEFTMPAHTFHFYPEVGDGFKAATQSLIDAIEKFYRDGITWGD